MKTLYWTLFTLALALAGCGKSEGPPAPGTTGYSAATIEEMATNAYPSMPSAAISKGPDGASTVTVAQRIAWVLDQLLGANPKVNQVLLGNIACTRGCGPGTYGLASMAFQKVNGHFELSGQSASGTVLPPNGVTATFSGGGFIARASATSPAYMAGLYTVIVVPGTSIPVGFAAAGFGPKGYGYCVYPGGCSF